jgi:hypothetical protein
MRFGQDFDHLTPLPNRSVHAWEKINEAFSQEKRISFYDERRRKDIKWDRFEWKDNGTNFKELSTFGSMHSKEPGYIIVKERWMVWLFNL